MSSTVARAITPVGAVVKRILLDAVPIPVPVKTAELSALNDPRLPKVRLAFWPVPGVTEMMPPARLKVSEPVVTCEVAAVELPKYSSVPPVMTIERLPRRPVTPVPVSISVRVPPDVS